MSAGQLAVLGFGVLVVAGHWRWLRATSRHRKRRRG